MANGRLNNDLYVTLSYSPLGLIGARAVELQHDSMSVDTGAITLPHHSEVEVTLSYRRDGRLQVHRLTALVTERTPEGTRLTFQHLPADTSCALQELQARRPATFEGVA